jgi:hypothetical protein
LNKLIQNADTVRFLKSRRTALLGHVMRMDGMRIPRRIFFFFLRARQQMLRMHLSLRLIVQQKTIRMETNGQENQGKTKEKMDRRH